MPLPTATQAGRGALPPGMLPYQDSQGGFFIAYPDTWVVLPGQGSVRFAENALILSEDSPAAGATVFVLTGQVGDIGNAAGRSIRNSRDLLNYVLEGLKAEQNPNFGPMELFQANGLVFAAAQGTYDDTAYKVRVKTYVVATVRGEQALTLVSGSPEEAFDNYWPTFEAMVRTISLR